VPLLSHGVSDVRSLFASLTRWCVWSVFDVPGLCSRRTKRRSVVAATTNDGRCPR